MKLIAVRPGQRLYEDDYETVVVDDDGTEHRSDLPVQAILARGYWREPTEADAT